MSQQHLNLHGYYLYYDNYDDVRYGIDYLYTLGQGEFDTLIDAAKADGTAEYHDQKYGGHYLIKYDTQYKTFSIEKTG